jgi:hypothetical protein
MLKRAFSMRRFSGVQEHLTTIISCNNSGTGILLGMTGAAVSVLNLNNIVRNLSKSAASDF